MLTNEMGLPQPFVDAATSDHRYKPHRYSVTEVLGGTCEAVLKRRHQGEGDSDVADYVWAIFGSAVHKILEQAQETESQLKENWISVPAGIEDYELSGIFDLYDDSTGTVTDYKTASIWKVRMGDFTDWQLQTLIYCWMLRQLGFDAHRGEVVALLKDHNKRDARFKSNEGYPPHPVFKIGWDFSEISFHGAEKLVKDWFKDVAKQEQRTDEMLMPCDKGKRWHKDDKYAVVERGKKKALRVLGSRREAEMWAVGKGIDINDGKHNIEYRKGEDTKCEGYCPVADFCPYARMLKG